MTREDYYGAGNVGTHSNWNDAGGTTATNLTTKKTRLLQIEARNNGATAAFLRLYDKATTPIPGTDVPKMTFMLPACGGKVDEKNMALEFTVGLSYAITSGAGDTSDGVTAGVNEVAVKFEYFDKFEPLLTPEAVEGELVEREGLLREAREFIVRFCSQHKNHAWVAEAVGLTAKLDAVLTKEPAVSGSFTKDSAILETGSEVKQEPAKLLETWGDYRPEPAPDSPVEVGLEGPKHKKVVGLANKLCEMCGEKNDQIAALTKQLEGHEGAWEQIAELMQESLEDGSLWMRNLADVPIGFVGEPPYDPDYVSPYDEPLAHQKLTEAIARLKAKGEGN